MYSDNFDSVTNNLRDSAEGNNDGYDVTFHSQRANGRRVGLAVASSVHLGLFCQVCESVDLEVVGDAQDWQQLLFLSPRCGLTPNEFGIWTTNDARWVFV